jgi:hypothetical protein
VGANDRGHDDGHDDGHDVRRFVLPTYEFAHRT